MNIVEHSFGRNESYRVTNVAKQYVVVELLKNGEMITMKRFEIGDSAEYDSYNLSYIGKIVSIGEKTVTIQEKGLNGRKHRLDTQTFAFRNYDFDLAEIAARNHEMMLSI